MATEGSDDEAEGLSVAQMAQATGVSAHTLRYYERAGLIHSIERTPGNQRRYHGTDIEWVQFLLRLRQTGMSIARMRDYARLRAEGETTLGERLDLLEQHEIEIREQLVRLQANLQALRTKIAIYRTQLDHGADQGKATA
ncbi:MerR family transcriptional regulator [Microlunatus parietis]|uniref:DNA-binding transcriptional MerR regulator n=1 Tax=Microlunatus parietis TaxID=682979 RepID=A0A7Y9I9R4_9ACTN|nr:MerR family transcriptional regulator [Microlunatus parietis]NYE72956.1 DNA-binding transcriptional MerR regulator [Microlunatus parietis]